MLMNKCIFFNGLVNETCEAGINYRKCVGGEDLGWGMRLPCVTGGNETRVSCSSRQEPTQEQLEKEEAEIQRMIENLEKVEPLVQKIKSEHKGTDWQGTVICPVCSGTLYLTHCALNGHVWGKCKKTGFLQWAE